MSCALAYLLCCRARCSAERLASALAFFPPESSYAYELESSAGGGASAGVRAPAPRLRWWSGRARCARLRRGTSPEALACGGVVGALPACAELAVEVERRGGARTPAVAWRWPGAAATLLVAHGNAADVGQLRDFCAGLAVNARVNVVAFEYDGYGPARGAPDAGFGAAPTSRAACAAAGAVYEFLLHTDDARWRVAGGAGALVLYGQSLGSGPLCWLAARAPARGVVLHAGIASALRVVTDSRCLAPCDIFDNLRALPALARRCDGVLVIHGTADAEVPVSHGRRLAAAAAAAVGARRAGADVAAALGDGGGGLGSGAAAFAHAHAWFADGAGHNDVVATQPAPFFAALREFLAALLVRPDARPAPPARGRTAPPPPPTAAEAHTLAALAAPVREPVEIAAALAAAWARAGAHGRSAAAARAPARRAPAAGAGKEDDEDAAAAAARGGGGGGDALADARSFAPRSAPTPTSTSAAAHGAAKS
jgi:hypothetical protein